MMQCNKCVPVSGFLTFKVVCLYILTHRSTAAEHTKNWPVVAMVTLQDARLEAEGWI